MRQLQVCGLTKRFGGLLAVDDVSFNVVEGSIKALIGPNGAGKSTLFNMLTGFETPDAGSVGFEGQEIVGRTPRDLVLAGLARTFQNTQLFDHMSTLENVMVGAEGRHGAGFLTAALRLPSSNRAEKDALRQAEHALTTAGIRDWAETPAGELPAGIRRLAEIARALATRPRLLLLDEPAAGLNASESAELSETLRRTRDSGVTIVIVEHDMGLVMGVADEIVVLDRGRKIAEGPPRMIQKDPAVISAYLGVEGEAYV